MLSCTGKRKQETKIVQRNLVVGMPRKCRRDDLGAGAQSRLEVGTQGPHFFIPLHKRGMCASSWDPLIGHF